MKTPKILIVEANYYAELAGEIGKGAIEALEARGATFERAQVPGVLEIPAAVRYAVGRYDGFVALGCVIRGETTHYDIVSNESARALMALSVEHQLALGNGIQTVENEDQAWARCKRDGLNKGGGAANACLDMIELKEKLGV
jgi:6,7-dimethyl-8-ribityllumazine synthase